MILYRGIGEKLLTSGTIRMFLFEMLVEFFRVFVILISHTQFRSMEHSTGRLHSLPYRTGYISND